MGYEVHARSDGRDAITTAVRACHGPPAPWLAAGVAPPALGSEVRAISGYRAADHWHLVTYALTELWVKRTDDVDWSGLGLEFTLRVPSVDEEPPAWAPAVLGFMCRWVRSSGMLPSDGDFLVLPEWLPEDGWARPWPGVAFLLDGELGAIDTPHGSVAFLQLVGLSEDSLDELRSASALSPRAVRTRVRRRVAADHPGDPLLLSPATLPVA